MAGSKVSRRYKRILKKINQLAPTMEAMTNEELQAQTEKFKARYEKGESLDSLLVEAYATIREAAKRVLHMYPYDVQMLGAIVLHEGKIAEMRTGEGKTLVAAMPLYLNALTGKSTILVTMNNYLACRDGKQMGELFGFMGLTTKVGVKEDAAAQLTLSEKKEAYAADILYTTNGTLGFDYLTENLGATKDDRYLRPYYYVIIDEADAVLLDSAQTPLVISGAPRVQSNLYETADFFITTLREEDYEIDEQKGKAWLTDSGIRKAEVFYSVDNLYAEENFELVRHLILALRAHVMFHPQKEYISADGKIKLLDSNTGRIIENTKLRAGQHQALEAREHVEVTQESRSMASITFQGFFNMFPKIAGMSGTAFDDVDEFQDIYQLDVVQIPTHKPLRRKDLPDYCYYNHDDQIRDAVFQIEKLHEKGQPVLLIANSIYVTEKCSEMLLRAGIPHNVLNAYNVAKEAEIIKEAGRYGAVTVATSVAGRGTDIKLGEGVNDLGGLAVIGVGILDNLRMEKQARGRSGRQGDNGFSRFYVSLEDDLVKDYGPEKLQKFAKIGEGKIAEKRIRKQIRKAQRNCELAGRENRKKTMQFAESGKAQRNLIYQMRRDLMDRETIDMDFVLGIQEELTDRFLSEYKKTPSEEQVIRYYLDHISYDMEERPSKEHMKSKESIKEYLQNGARKRLRQQEEILETDNAKRYFYQLMMLKAIDTCWIEQVDYMQQLRITVSGRSYAQRNVMYEYHKEAHAAYLRMVQNAKEKMMQNLLLSEIEKDADDELRIVTP